MFEKNGNQLFLIHRKVYIWIWDGRGWAQKTSRIGVMFGFCWEAISNDSKERHLSVRGIVKRKSPFFLFLGEAVFFFMEAREVFWPCGLDPVVVFLVSKVDGCREDWLLTEGASSWISILNGIGDTGSNLNPLFLSAIFHKKY